MLQVLKGTVQMSSFEHPKQMVKFMDKKLITILLSKTVTEIIMRKP